MRIPKNIHFIWAGGVSPVFAYGEETIKLWATKYTDVTITLWIDKKTAGNGYMLPESRILVSLQEYYKNAFTDIGDRLIIKDIEEEKVSSEIVRYYIDSVNPNYGASSDLLRYRILEKFGGVYFDTDVRPSKNDLFLQLSLFDVKQEHFFGINQNTQNKRMIGNDAILSTPNNPLIKKIIKKAEENH